MSKSLAALSRIALGLIILGTASVNLFAQSVSGEWTATVKESANKIHLNTERRTARGGRNQNGQTFDFSDLQGLNRDQAQRGGPVRFSLVREAGRIDYEGSFQNGKGSGTFSFTGDQGYVASMRNRGFDFAKNDRDNDWDNTTDRLFSAVTLNITTALADDLASSGFDNLRVNDLFKAAIFKIDSKFMREMKASGFPNLTMEDLVKARIFKIDAEFVTQVTQMGLEKEGFESLVKMQIFKVTPQFVSEVRNEGLTDLRIEDVVKLRIFKIDAEYIRLAKSDGVPMEVEKLVQRKLGVGRKY